MSMPPDEAIVLTGCGWVTPFAAGTIPAVLEAAAAGSPEASTEQGYRSVPDDVVGDLSGLSSELQRDRGGVLAGTALLHACRQAGFTLGDDPERTGLVLADALAGQAGMISFANEVRDQSARFVSPLHFPQTVGNYTAGALARGLNLRGPNLTLAAAGPSALHALIQARDLLAAGDADVILTGGVTALTPELARGLPQAKAGLSEGACLFVMERSASAAARGAEPLARVVATGVRKDGDESLSPNRAAILSGAGCRRPGAIWIDHWIGRCDGPAGAAAAAAAIGAASGCEVPVVDAAAPEDVSIKRYAATPSPSDRGPARVVVFADTGSGTYVTLELEIPFGA
jgi:3-oxoacyl-[acyl-carrier-protein] synthase II